MKYIHLEVGVNENMRDLVINTLNEEGEVTFYINSEGGRSEYAYQIIDVINKNKERVTLVATLQIASAAFMIFFESKCKREVLDDTEGLAHMAKISVRINGNKDFGSTDNWRMKEMMKEDKKQCKVLESLGVSKKNRKLFLKGYDIYFTTAKLRKMLAKSI